MFYLNGYEKQGALLSYDADERFKFVSFFLYFFSPLYLLYRLSCFLFPPPPRLSLFRARSLVRYRNVLGLMGTAYDKLFGLCIFGAYGRTHTHTHTRRIHSLARAYTLREHLYRYGDHVFVARYRNLRPPSRRLEGWKSRVGNHHVASISTGARAVCVY